MMDLNTIFDKDALDQLVLISREPVPRDALVLPNINAVVNTALSLVQALSSGRQCDEDIIEELTQALRVLRNACSAGQAAGERLLTLGLIDLLVATIDAITAGITGLNWTLPAVVAQLIVNAAATGSACASACWTALFPARLLTLSHVDTPQAQAATALALLTMCRSIEGASKALAGQDGAPMLAAMLHAANRRARMGECNENLGLLITYLVFEEELLEELFSALSGVGNIEVSRSSVEGPSEDALASEGRPTNTVTAANYLTAAHTYLLQELTAEVHDVPMTQGNSTSTSTTISTSTTTPTKGSMVFLASVLRELSSRKAQPLNGVQQQVLQDTLHLLRDLCARDDDGTAFISKGDHTVVQNPTSPVQDLLETGLVRNILSLLKALGPIMNSRRDAPAVPVADLAPLLQEGAEECTTEQPYIGYRSDILSVLANAAHRRPSVQAAVAELQGVELVLSQAQVDEKSPLAREWGLWAVRNLCEGSEAARDAISELRACAAVDSEELRQAGVKLSIDEETGKLKVLPRGEGEKDTPSGSS